MAKEWLTVREYVRPLVLWVDVLVQTGAIVHVGVLKDEFDRILLAFLEQSFVQHFYSMVSERHILIGCNALTIYFNFGYLLSLEIEE